ncbi:MAG: hypothetical protein FWB72_02450 [Firmicutes bacterium]|nr:hypothetical protein [Bacillota bacterium]
MFNEKNYAEYLYDLDKHEPTMYDEQKLKKKQKLVRDDFKTVGKFNMPFIKKQNIDISKVELLYLQLLVRGKTVMSFVLMA